MIKPIENSVYGIGDNLYEKKELIDAIRLQKQLLIEEDILFSIEECINIWHNHSLTVQAGWLSFPTDDNFLLASIRASEGFVSFSDWSKPSL